jgi:hypothetical protein
MSLSWSEAAAGGMSSGLRNKKAFSMVHDTRPKARGSSDGGEGVDADEPEFECVVEGGTTGACGGPCGDGGCSSCSGGGDGDKGESKKRKKFPMYIVLNSQPSWQDESGDMRPNARDRVIHGVRHRHTHTDTDTDTDTNT